MRVRRLWIAGCLLGTVLAVGRAEASAIVIGGGTDISPFGEPDTATYGQTFKTPDSTDVVIDSFSFWLNDFLTPTSPDAVDFAGYIMEWDTATSRATGNVLYSSSQRSTTNNGGQGGYERFDFLTGGLLLDPLKTYVAFVSASGFFDGSPGLASMSGSLTDQYADGEFVFNNNGNNFGALTTTTWDTLGVFIPDAQFEAQFSSPTAAPVPEPASLVLLGSGLAAAYARKRRAQRREPRG